MAETWWADYSAAKLTAEKLRAHGYSGVIRYIDEPRRLGWKHTTRDEWRDLAGLERMLVFEVNVDDPVGGYARGVAYAKRAKAGADYLGYNGVIFFCADGWFASTGVTAGQWRAYLDGAASVLGIQRVGAYGFQDAMDTAVGHAAVFWQAGARRHVRPHVHIWQDNNVQPVVFGVQTDRNLVLKPIIGGGGAAGGGDDDMFSDEDRATLDLIRRVVAVRYPRGAINGKMIDGDWHGDTGEYVRVVRREIAALRDGQAKMLELLAQQAAVSAEDIAAALRAGLAADLGPVLQDVIGDELADTVLDRLATRLHDGSPA